MSAPRPTRRQLKRAGIVVLALLAFASGVVGLRIADPFAPQPEAPNISSADSPEAMAHAAMQSTERGRYVATYGVGRTRDGRATAPGVLTYRFDGPDRQIRYSTDRNVSVFANPYFTWTRSEDGRVRRQSSGPSSISPGIEPFYHEEEVRGCNCVAVQRRTEGSMTLVVRDDRWVNTFLGGEFEDGSGDARLTLVINTERDVLRRARYTLAEGNRSTVLEWTYSRWGEVDVSRPGWAGYSVDEFVADLRNEERGP